MKKFIFINPGSTTAMQMFKDLEKSEIDGFQMIMGPVDFKNHSLLKGIWRAWTKISSHIGFGGVYGANTIRFHKSNLTALMSIT